MIIHREVHDADPAKWPNKKQFKYSAGTSNTSLRPHIEREHLDLYLKVAKERSWKLSLPGLLSQARTQAASQGTASQGTQSAEFSQDAFHQHLLNFIVADDQVRDACFLFILLCSCFVVPNHKSLNVVECPEFRKLLLLLRSDLKDSQIPRRTKIRELLLQAWKTYFQVLRSDLAVGLPPHPLLHWSFFSFY